MKIINRIRLSIVLLLFNTIIHAQAIIGIYGYDLNGNRTSASVIYLMTSLKSTIVGIDSLVGVTGIKPTDTIGLPKDGWSKGIPSIENGFSVKVYPNPNHGLLVLEFSDISDNQLNKEGNAIKVWGLQGNLVMDKAITSGYNSIDLSNAANGTYIMKLFVNGTIKVYKIIKD